MTSLSKTDLKVSASRPRARLAYLVSHPIQYQAPLLRRLAQEPDIDLTVLFGSDFSVRGYKDEGFGVNVEWDVPLLEGYRSVFLPRLRDKGTYGPLTPLNRGIYRALHDESGAPAFDMLWIHGYASVNALQGILAANLLGIPVAMRNEAWLGDHIRTWKTLALKGAFMKLLERSLSACLCVGSLNGEYWSHYFGDRVPQFAVPYAVDNDFFRTRSLAAAPQREQLRAELHLEPGRPVILFASKLQHRKHADHLVQAFHRLLQSSTEIMPYLVIVGEGEERANLERLVRELNLTDVRFAGFRNQSELPRYFDLADVFVLPSRHEQWGLIINEAMASGCAVIVTDEAGATPDLVTDGAEGFVYPAGNVGALTDALARIFATPGLTQRMGEAALERMSTWGLEQGIAGLRLALATLTRKIRP